MHIFLSVFTEGLFVTCSYDYLTEDWNHKSFLVYAFVFNYCIPILMVIMFYSQIVKAVVSHEAALKAQAKKMNVDSLRSNADAKAESAEVRIAKVAITNVTLWICIWTPYAVVVMIAAFGDRNMVTPMVSQLPSFCSKLASVLNPFVFAISHPKFREALTDKCPCLGIGDKPEANDDQKTVATEKWVYKKGRKWVGISKKFWLDSSKMTSIFCRDYSSLAGYYQSTSYLFQKSRLQP